MSRAAQRFSARALAFAVLQVMKLQLSPLRSYLFFFLRRLTAFPTIVETLIEALNRRGKDALHSLTAVSNNAGIEGLGGLSLLVGDGQIERLVLSYLGNNKTLEKKYLTGQIAVELCPQGSLAERIRAAGAGIPAFFTPTGARKLTAIRCNDSLQETALIYSRYTCARWRHCRPSGSFGQGARAWQKERSSRIQRKEVPHGDFATW